MKQGKKTKKERKLVKIILIESLALLTVFLLFSAASIFRKQSNMVSATVEKTEPKDNTSSGNNTTKTDITELESKEYEIQKEEELERQEALEREKKEEQERAALIEKADLIAAGYDYDAAIALIQGYGESYTQYKELTESIERYQKEKDSCVPFGAYTGPDEVSHVFFHSLIYDTSKAFDGDYKENGYNYYMTTVSEFNAMMEQMYSDGYVLVSIHDVAKKVTKEDGTSTFEPGDILLPPDKKPFVLSQDDVNYYDYMDGDGFASRMVIDEEGLPSTERILEDGSTEVGAFDLVPVLEAFVKEHPDFSYRGARGIIALTGYEGTLGYRTDPASSDSETYEMDKETVKEVAKVMREHGWEFACHSNGHRNMLEKSYDFVVNDTKNWLTNVGSLVGETDIYIFPYGIDIQTGAGAYNNDKYKYLKQSGFEYFCGVYKEPWIQVKKDYVRMTRRPLDGQAMLQFPERLQDLFDLSRIIDPARPELK